jgi:hypothetical protein
MHRFLYSSNRSKDQSRQHVLEHIRQNKKLNPDYRVIDIGGGLNPWAGELVDAYVDINNPKGLGNVFSGDMNDSGVWDQIKAAGPKFDFSICTHTLEDIRNPVFVLQQIASVSKSGYISMPSKHTEFSNHQSNFWNGSAHHRWVFSIKSDEQGEYLFFMPIWPGASYFNKRFSNALVWLKRTLHLTNKDMNYGSRNLGWLDKKISTNKNELGFIWQSSIPMKFVDFASSNVQMIDDYRTLLAEGL